MQLKKHFFLTTCFLLLCLNSYSQQKKSSATLDKKIGQMIIVGFRGIEAPPQSAIAQSIKKQHIGGVVLFDYDVPADSALRNVQSPGQLQSLTRQLQQYANIPLLITIDQEGGKVSRLKEKFGFPASVSAQYLGRLDNPDTTRYYAQKTARILANAGINVNLAPVVDVDLNADNPVIGGLERSFSADPQTVTNQASAYIDAMHKRGILTTLKHFPGHGSSDDDSHKGIVDVTGTWQQKELLPYKKLIRSNKADIIMTAHIFNAKLDSVYPATLSQHTITGLLRDSLGYEGVIMSDDLQMGAIRKYYELKETVRLSIEAGVDMLVFANNSVFDADIAKTVHRIIKELIAEGEITEERVDRSYNRIMELKEEISKPS